MGYEGGVRHEQSYVTAEACNLLPHSVDTLLPRPYNLAAYD